MKPVVLFVALLLPLLLVPGASAGGDTVWDGVPYYFASGGYNGSHLSFGPGFDASNLPAFKGCALFQLRPEKEGGLVRVTGLLDEDALLGVAIDEFQAPGGPGGGAIERNVTIDGSETGGQAKHPRTLAEVAAWGSSTLVVNDDEKSGSSAYRFDTSAFLTRAGFRDDENQKVLSGAGATFDPSRPDDFSQHEGELEMHVQMRQNGRPAPAEVRYVSPTIPYEQNHRQRFEFENTRWGGEVKVQFGVTSQAPPAGATTQLEVELLSPSLQSLGKKTVSANAVAAGGASIVAPLSEFGVYEVMVSGSAVAANYTVAAQLRAAQDLQLNFWFDDVKLGTEAIGASNDCESRFDARLQPVGGQVLRPKTPTWNYEVVGLGIVAGITGVLFLVKVVGDAVVTGAFRSAFRKH